MKRRYIRLATAAMLLLLLRQGAAQSAAGGANACHYNVTGGQYSSGKNHTDFDSAPAAAKSLHTTPLAPTFVTLIQAPTTVAELKNIYDVNGSVKTSDLDLLKYIQSQPAGIGNTEIGPKAKVGVDNFHDLIAKHNDAKYVILVGHNTKGASSDSWTGRR
jgi:hypothetical protein